MHSIKQGDHDLIRQRVLTCRDAELPEAERRELLAHVDGCPDCRAASRRWETLARAFFRAPQPSPSEPFVRRVMARVETERRDSLWWEGAWRWLVPALGAGIAALVLVVTTPWQNAPVSTETLLLASSAGNGAFEEMLPLEMSGAEEQP